MRKGIFLVAFIPWSLWALSQRPLFSKKDGKTNNAVVDMVALSLDNGGHVEKKWLDPLLSNATSRIHDNGVVELRYASGLRSYSVAGKEPKTRFKQAGALFPKGWIKENVGGTEITHVQTRPILDRISKAYRKYLPLKYAFKFEMEMSLIEQLDQFLLEMILSGSPDDLAYMLKEYPHKVSVESQVGRTVYLKLDNPITNGVSILRVKGVMPKRNILGRFVTHLTSEGW